MSQFIESLPDYFNAVKNSDGFPEKFINDLFLIGKCSADTDCVKEIRQLLKQHASQDIQNAFKCRKKLIKGEKEPDMRDVFCVLCEYASLSAELDVDYLYARLGHTIIDIRAGQPLEALCERPELLARFPSVTFLAIEEVPFCGQQLPESIGSLPLLEKLNIEGDYKTLPKSIEKLKKLQEFKIDSVPLESLGLDFRQLTNLSSLTWYYTPICGAELFDLPAGLTKIDLGRIPDLQRLGTNLDKLPQLQHLKISCCPQLASIDEKLTLANLNNLTLWKNPLLSSIHANTVLGNQKTSFTNGIDIRFAPKVYEEITRLQIQEKKLLALVCEHAACFPNLKELHLGYTRDLTGIRFPFGAFSQLESIWGADFVDDGFWDELPLCKSLKNLSFNSTSSETIPESFKEIAALDSLSIINGQKLTIDASLLPRNIKKLEIDRCHRLIAPTRLLTLDELILSHCPVDNERQLFSNISTAVMKYYPDDDTPDTGEELSQYLPQPERLTSFTTRLATAKIADLLMHCHNLASLNIDPAQVETEREDGCANPRETLPGLNCPAVTQLTSLELHHTNVVTLGPLLTNSPKLETVKLNKFDDFPANVSLPRLKTLLISRSDLKTLASLDAPALETLKLALCYEFGLEATKALVKYTHLHHLKLMGMHKSLDHFPMELKALPLKRLSLRGGDIKVIPDFIGEFTELDTLSLEDFVTESLPESMLALEKLERLSIDCCKFLKPIPPSFRKLKLKVLCYTISKFSGFNMNPKLYQNLLTPNYTEQTKYLDD
ncbi:hypothetical protein [Shewanella algae]|uniref:hypothetical protein n=1 Tax=Shewanella algae TaxID=38313 RepID=UPI001AAF90E0|nr:hypothetical protein [Shewanella algae]MBO2577322.1 hypothetical protein [Shewanella algae]BCV60533.1 hypothetical protein TUM17386_02040 [Shewanella algae]